MSQNEEQSPKKKPQERQPDYDIIWDAMKGMSPEENLVIMLRVLGDSTISDIAENLDMDRAQVAVLLVTALRDLRNSLAHHMPELTYTISDRK